MKKLFFAYNPYAGKGMIKEHLSEVLDIFVKAGYELTVRPTQHPGDALEQAEHLPEGYDLFVVSGGDGTLDEAVTGMMRREPEKRIPIGYLPMGSTNDFGNSIGLPKEVAKAARVAVNGIDFPCDMGRINEKHVFVYVAAFGLFTDVSYETPQEMKNTLGHFAYILEGTKRLANVKSYHMKVIYDGGELEDDFIYGMVSNSKSVGGFKNLLDKTKVAFDDGCFEVTLVKKPQNIANMSEIVGALLMANYNSDYMLTFHTTQICFESEEKVAWTMDGEDGGKRALVNIRIDPSAVTLKVPEDALSKVSYEYLKNEMEPEISDQ